MSQLPSDKSAELALVCGMLQGRPMPELDASLFTDSRLREAWRAGQAAVEDGKDPYLAILPDYLNTKVCSITDLVNFDSKIPGPVGNMEIYAKGVIGAAVRRSVSHIADQAIKIAQEERSPGRPLEYMVEQAKAELRRLDLENVATTRSAIEELVLGQEGDFKQSQLYIELNARDDAAKTNIRMAVKRMKEAGIIEPVKSRGAGWYRVCQLEEETIDFLNEDDRVIELALPFALDEMFVTRPKNIIVVAGEPDAGKTALLLNIARLNMRRMKTHYFSSEMGANEFRARLKQFEKLDTEDDEFTTLSEWKINAVERSEDFQDLIRPNDLNIIDFLEVHEEFWAVGGMIKKIFDKLDEGVAVIAIQKTNTTSDYGLGGLRGLEKPRLYISLKNGENYHTAKIVKCKSAREPEELNPNGLELDFKLVRGCLFVPVNPIIRPNGQKRYWKRPKEREAVKERLSDEHPFY